MILVGVVVVVCGRCGVCGVARGRPPCVDSKRLRVYIQNVSVCTGTTRTCQVHMFDTCGRGAGTDGDVLNGHGGVLNLHTEEGGGHRQFCLPKNHPRRVLTGTRGCENVCVDGCMHMCFSIART